MSIIVLNAKIHAILKIAENFGKSLLRNSAGFSSNVLLQLSYARGPIGVDFWFQGSPKPDVWRGQIRGARRPQVLRNDSVAKILSEKIHDCCCGVRRSAILLEPFCVQLENCSFSAINKRICKKIGNLRKNTWGYAPWKFETIWFMPCRDIQIILS